MLFILYSPNIFDSCSQTVEIAGDSIFTSSSDSGPATVDSEGGVGGGGGPPPAAAVAAAVSEPQESEKEEVKGPRPTASVPVPGIYTLHILYINGWNLYVYFLLRYTMAGGVDQ